MAISTDSTIVFFGTQDDLDSSSAAVSDGAFSASTDLASWTNDDDAPMASVVGLFTYSVAPAGGSEIELYGRPLNIVDTTKDQNAPNTDQRVTYLGSFILDNVTSEQVLTIDVDLTPLLTKTSQEIEFYILNQGGQSLSSGWSLQITPKAYGPHA